MTTSTIVQRIARAAVGVAAASLIVGQATPAFANAGPAGNSWDTATAVFTGTDGKQTTVKANSVRFCGYGFITLSGTQDIEFEKMRRLEVTRSDKHLQSEGKADLAVTALTGKTLNGTMRINCQFSGDNEVGRFSLYPEELKSVEFHRAGEPAPTGPVSAGDSINIEVKIQSGDRKTTCRITINPQAQQPTVAQCTPH